MPNSTDYPSPYLSYPSSDMQSPRDDDIYKASYDNLIDQHATPFERSPNHQTYTLDSSGIGSQGHSRGQSFPPEQKPYYAESTSKHSEYTEDDISTQTYPPFPVKDTDTRGLWAKILPDSLACRLYVITVLIETTIDLAIESDLLVRVHESDEADQSPPKMPVYLSIFVLAHVFQFIVAVDAVYARNTLQFLFLTVFNALFLVYAIIQISELRTSLANTSAKGFSHIPIDILTTIIPIVISVAELAYIALGWKIYHEFGWKVYKFLGADRQIKKMYANYQIFDCLIKFDVFFWVGFSVQFIWLVLQSNDWEYYVTYAALPLSILLLVEGHLAARHENKWMMATFMSGCVGALVYFIYKLFKVLKNRHNPQFILIYKTLTTFSVIAIVLLLATFVFAAIVMRNFGRGLKTQMSKSQQSTTQHNRWKGSQHLHHRAMSTNPNRMTID